MTPEQKQLVKQTWAMVAPTADAVIAMFYDRLFEIDPSTRKLFRATDMADQRRKITDAVALAVDGLEDLDALVPILEDLGRRHARYGVTDDHYDSVGAALLWTLQQGLGGGWTPAVAAAWTALYGTLSGTMRAAARPAVIQRGVAA